MQPPFKAHARSFDANAINQTIQRALASAGLDTTSGPMHSVTETIRQALASSGMSSGLSVAAVAPAANDSVIDIAVRVVNPGEVGAEPSNDWSSTAEVETGGTFETCQFSNRAGTRSYKLYVPASASEGPRPMVVMLHGCTQSADDFAAGTQMNQLADEHGFLVVYPEQSAQANMSKCWNWFQQRDQLRDAGEPSLIAGIVLEVAARHGADSRRVFVAGLSAGAAMAVVLGETYPDVFAGVGVHSGLPYGSAHDIPSAMAAMKGGRSGLPGIQVTPNMAPPAPRKLVQAVPTIVFHGDRDHTVQQTNATAIAQQAREAYLADAGAPALSSDTERGTASGGRSFSRTIHADSTGHAHIEVWTVHGAGHAWSGGDARGSYTDRTGPDASAEMIRFFLALPRAGSS
jgi:poly(hydroxyalkanoate) depolymerase family esterase